jgi:hypothetical protein
MSETKILLEESVIPTRWYNVVADMPNPPVPPLGADGEPIGAYALTAIFSDALIEQEVSVVRFSARSWKIATIPQRPSTRLLTNCRRLARSECEALHPGWGPPSLGVCRGRKAAPARPCMR